MVQFPKTITYDDTNKPDWLAVIKENNEDPFQLTLTIENWDRIRFDEVNIEGLLVDLPKALADTGLTVADVNALITFLRFTAPKITLVLNGTGTDVIEIILPPGLTIADVVKAGTGEKIPFFFNTARNSVVVTVTFASVVEIELLVRSIQNVLNQAVQTIVSVLVTTSVLQVIFTQLGDIMREVRERV
jgi:hypothetical protein